MLKDRNYGIIENILQRENGAVYFVGEKYVPSDCLYNNPDSTIINITIATITNAEKHLRDVEDAIAKVWKVSCKTGIITIPLAHNT